MQKALKELFDKLTDEQKAKAKECKTAEELMDFAGKEGVELPDELLDNVAGGLSDADINRNFEELRRRLFEEAERMRGPQTPEDLYDRLNQR